MDGIGFGTFLFLLILGLIWPIYRQMKRRRLRRLRILERFTDAAAKGLSLEPKDYQFPQNSFKRSNRVERRFRRDFYFELLEIFDHSCGNCASSKTKLEIDHFFIPKSFGGNLMMKHRDGYWVSNGILLCRRCNANKADQKLEKFFDEKTLKTVLRKNTRTSYLLNGLGDPEITEFR